MFKKIIVCAFIISLTNSWHTLYGSGTPNTHTSTQTASKELNEKNNFLTSATQAVTTTINLINPVYAIYTAVSATFLCSAYGSYYWWKKSILDAELGAMKQEIKRKLEQVAQDVKNEVARSAQDTNKHVTLEILRSEQKQTEHTTTQLHILKADLSNHINCKTESTQSLMNTIHTKQNELHTQTTCNHKEIIKQLNAIKNIRLAYTPPTAFAQLNKQ